MESTIWVVRSLLVVTFLTQNAFGQLAEKTKVIGQGFSYSMEERVGPDGSENTETSVEITPSVGYFIVNNLMVSLSGGYFIEKDEIRYPSSSYKTELKGYMLSPQVRYFMKSANEQFNFFAQASFSYQPGKRTDSGTGGPGIEFKTLDWSVNFAPGVNYFISDRIGLEFNFNGISYYKNDPNKDIDNNERKGLDISLNSILPSAIGFRFYF